MPTHQETGASDFIAERARELIYQGKLDEDILDRFEVLADKIIPNHVNSPLNALIKNLLLEIVRLARSGEYR